MATLIKTAYDGYRYIFYDCSDPRIRDWMLMGGPVPLVTILITYLYFCKSAGQRWMKDRQPFDLKYVLIVYNAIMVAFNTWLLNEALQAGWLRDYNYKCQPIDYSNSPAAVRMADGFWWYLVSKLVELLDTVFFVLRKKKNQISHLHLWHHTMMPIASWITLTYAPSGHGTFCGMINTFVHIIMYTYYLLAALGPTVQKYLWWKKHLTKLQLVQFAIVFLHGFQVLIFECDFPKIIVCMQLSYSLYFIYMFGAFYTKTYRSKRDA